MKKLPSASRKAWLSVLGAFIVSSGAGYAGALSLFYLPVGEELGFSQTSLGLYVSIMSLCGIISHPIVGRLLVRFERHIRLFALVGGALALGCYAWLSTCTRLYQFYIGGFGMGFLLPFLGALYGSTVVTHWFEKKRSVAISIVAVGTSLGTVLYSQLGRFFIEHSGWRSAYLAIGVTIAITCVIGALFISPPPKYLGMKPYGWEEKAEGSSVISGFTLKEALHSVSFWIFAAAAVIASAYIMGVQQSVMPMLQVDFSMNAAMAVTMMNIYSIVCACAKPIMGVVYSKCGVRRTVILVGSMVCASMLILGFGSGVVAALAAMVLLGLGNMFGTVIMASYVAESFGNRAYSAILGYMNIAYTLGVSIGPIICGRAFDSFGGYRVAYFVFAAFCAASSLLILLSKRNLARDISRLENKNMQLS